MNQWTHPGALAGPTLRLEPLELEHAGALLAIADPATFAFMLRTPSPWDETGFSEYIGFRTMPGNWPFAVVDQASGVVVGHSSYLDMSEEHRHVEIGHTWYSPEVRGTRVNPECKLMMLTHAFEVLNCVRVQLKCDARNLRSRAAISKLGAQFEGVLRSNMILEDGTCRDTAYFSIIQSEWPVVKAGLLARIQ